MSITITQLLGQLVRHGQYMMVYPSAFLPRDAKTQIDHPRQYELPGDEIELTTSDKITLRCYLITRLPASSGVWSQFLISDAICTIILCHGNGMNHGDMLFSAREFYQRRCNVLTLSYRGYGTSEGSPTESGLRRDAQAAIDYIKGDQQLSSLPIVVYGLSLGGAVAIDLTSRNPDTVAALIIENTFLSLPAVVRDWPYIGVFSFACHQRWNSAKAITRIPTSTPILMLSGKQDEVVPCKHMHSLHEIANKRGEPVERSFLSFKSPSSSSSSSSSPQAGTYDSPKKDHFQSFEAGFHANTMVQEGYWPTIEQFLRKVCSE